MGLRKFVAVIAGIIAFIGTGSLIAIGVQNIWPGYAFSDHPFERLSLLFISFLVASSVYNMIKGDEPEVNENQKINHDKVSKKHEEMRNPDRYCHNCGSSNIDIAQYYAFCGSKLDL